MAASVGIAHALTACCGRSYLRATEGSPGVVVASGLPSLSRLGW